MPYRFLHDHPGMQERLGVPKDHVVVDRADWERAVRMCNSTPPADRPRLRYDHLVCDGILIAEIVPVVWTHSPKGMVLSQREVDIRSVSVDINTFWDVIHRHVAERCITIRTSQGINLSLPIDIGYSYNGVVASAVDSTSGKDLLDG
jgi:hypothetical protein